ncbi:hypothetical protein [Virgibacillus kimchii]
MDRAKYRSYLGLGKTGTAIMPAPRKGLSLCSINKVKRKLEATQNGAKNLGLR